MPNNLAFTEIVDANNYTIFGASTLLANDYPYKGKTN